FVWITLDMPFHSILQRKIMRANHEAWECLNYKTFYVVARAEARSNLLINGRLLATGTLRSRREKPRSVLATIYFLFLILGTQRSFMMLRLMYTDCILCLSRVNHRVIKEYT